MVSFSMFKKLKGRTFTMVKCYSWDLPGHVSAAVPLADVLDTKHVLVLLARHVHPGGNKMARIKT
jgi:hypothetical protein